MNAGRRIGRFERAAAVALALLGFAISSADALAQFTCQAELAVAAVLEPNAVLERDPRRLDARMRLAAALMERGCYADVVVVLEAGQEFHPNVTQLQLLLRDARSLLAEEQYFEGLEEAEAAARLKRDLLRCRELDDVAACDSVLRERPNDFEILLAEDDAELATAAFIGEAPRGPVTTSDGIALPQRRYSNAEPHGATH